MRIGLYSFHFKEEWLPENNHQLNQLKQNFPHSITPIEGPKKCSVYLKLPWIGNILLKFEKQVISNVQECFRFVKPRVIFKTKNILPSIH